MVRGYLLRSIMVGACLLGGMNQCSAANTKSVAQANGKKKAAAPKIDPDQQELASALVDSHLPELKNLIERLRKDSPRQYAMAIRDLAKSARKLQAAKNRDEQYFEVELEHLKAQTNVKIFAAKVKVRDNESDRQQLRKAIERLHAADVGRSEYNVRILKERLKKTQQQLESAEKRLATTQSNRQSRIEKSYASYLNPPGKKATDAKAKSPKPNKRK